MAAKARCAKDVQTGKVPSDACLRSAARDIAHDLKLLQLAWDQRSTRLGWTMWFVTSRVMWNFFFETKRKVMDKATGLLADDVLASDYLDSWPATAAALKKQAPPDNKRIRQAANKFAAHLTFSRADERLAQGVEPSAELHNFLLGVAAVWLNSLVPDRRVWFGSPV